MSTPMIFCEYCGAANSNNATLCFACNQPVQVTDENQQENSLTTNQLLHQRYRVLQRIGKGGFGEVYRGADTQLGGRTVAIKIINQSGLDRQELSKALDDFKNEAFLLANLKHAHLPSIHDYFTEAGRAYLVMDFIEGMALEQFREMQPGGRLPVSEVLEIARQLCDVLEYLHSQQPAIIFRDLKPANVMRTANRQLYLIDFGIARLFKPGQTKDTTAFGSAGYAAPEQYGKAQTTAQSDIYSLGATLHELLTGTDPSENPFQFESPHDVISSIHPDFSALIMQMLSINPRQRPANITEIHQQIQDNTILWTENYRASSASIKQLEQNYTDMGKGAIAWSPDGTLLAYAYKENQVCVWNPTSGDTFNLYQAHTDMVLALAWSPKETSKPGIIASGSRDRTVHIWKADDKQPSRVHRKHLHNVTAVAWSPDGKYVVSTSFDKTAQVWNMYGDIITIFRGHQDLLYTAAWSPDGQLIASGGFDGIVYVWGALNRITRLSYRGHACAVNALVWSPDGNYIVSGDENGDLHMWDIVKGELIAIHRQKGSVRAVCWSPNGRYIASCGEKGVEIWEVWLWNTTMLSSTPTNAIAYSPTGNQIAAIGQKRVELWEILPQGEKQV